MRWALFAIVVTVIFTVFTTVFAASAPARSVRVLPKWVWVLVCLLVPVVGGLLYLTTGRPIDAPTGGGSRAPKTKAPDDDPEFLRDLAERLKRDEDEKPND